MAPDSKLTVDSHDFRRAVNIVKRMGTGDDGPAFLRVENDELTLDWYGTAAKSACKATAPFAVRLPGLSMRIIVRAGKHMAGPVEVCWSGDKLNFGSFSVPCEPLEDAKARSLPLGAGDLEILILGLTESPETLEQMGIAGGVSHAKWRIDSSAEHAAKALKWLHIDQDLVRSWIEAHVQARARGEVSFEMVSESDRLGAGLS